MFTCTRTRKILKIIFFYTRGTLTYLPFPKTTISHFTFTRWKKAHLQIHPFPKYISPNFENKNCQRIRA